MSVVDIARRYIGSPYVFGANGEKPGDKMDCSKFIQNVMRDMGISISRTTHTQKNEGQPVNFNEMIPGDCIYYDGHVVMYIGNGNIIHASPNGVVERNLYDTKKIITIRRFLSQGTNNNMINKILDLDLYNDINLDLKAAFHGDHNKLRKHLYDNGIKEGRTFSYIFDPKFYSDKYTDIKNAFGGNYEKIFEHYFKNGINEERQGIIIFDLKFYKNTYKDLRDAFGNNNEKYVFHFIESGLREGRRASNEFDPEYYKNNNPDLKNIFGNDMKQYYKHFLIYGIKEGRQGHN